DTTGGSMTTYIWSFGDLNFDNTINTNHAYASGGSYNTYLVVSNAGCMDTFKKTLTINPKPTAIFFISDGCTGNRITPMDSSTNTGSGAAYYWNFGDTTISNSKSTAHIYKYAGNYNVFLRVTNSFGCAD